MYMLELNKWKKTSKQPFLKNGMLRKITANSLGQEIFNGKWTFSSQYKYKERKPVPSSGAYTGWIFYYYYLLLWVQSWSQLMQKK